MAEIFGDYITRVRRVLHETDEDTSMWSPEFLKQIFNDNYRLRCSQLIMAFEGFFIEIAERNIVANQSRYAWPAGFERLMKMELVRDDDTTVPVLRFERHAGSNPPPSSGGDAYYPKYRPIGSGFVLEPGPDTTVTNGLRIEYCALPAELTVDADILHPDFPKTYVSLLVYDTAVAALDSEHLMESGQATTIVRLRNEYDVNWERYIDGRMVSRNNVTPFTGHYYDA
jgi:hypothetical protein